MSKSTILTCLMGSSFAPPIGSALRITLFVDFTIASGMRSLRCVGGFMDHGDCRGSLWLAHGGPKEDKDKLPSLKLRNFTFFHKFHKFRNFHENFTYFSTPKSRFLNFM